MRLFCFPHAGGGASVYRTWPNDLPAAIEVCAVQLPGREDRLSEPPHASAGPLVHALVAALGPLLDRPFALFGHSMGALVAFELARHLRRLRAPEPVHLFVSAKGAPALPYPLREISSLPDAEFVRRICELAGTPPEVLANADLRAILLPLLRADFAICDRYVHAPEPPLACPISAFGGVDDVYAGRDALEAWHRETRARFSLRIMPGGHFFLQPARGQVLAAIAEDLGCHRS
jgi:surfactin synthase thioesterase subunit